MKSLLAAVVSCIVVLSAAPASADAGVDCHVGSYRLADGEVLDVGPSGGGTLRWRMFTGETGQLHRRDDGIWTSTSGWTDRDDGRKVSFTTCGGGGITFANQTGRQIAFDTMNTVFQSGDVRLAGRLVMPKGSGKVPLVVLVHGSEHDSALVSYPLQRMFPAQGVGVFVYDKRGTGASGGAYTQNFQTLAHDAVLALAEARRLAGSRVGRTGYQGGSEGGWVVPLAVNESKVDFAIVSFGLAVTVLEEDQQSVALDMRFHGHSADDTAKALEVARAGERVIETGDKEGYAEFDALRRRFKSKPWFKDLHGDFVFFILPLSRPGIDAALKHFDFQTPFRYEPMPALRASMTPQLWVLGGDDLEAPSAETGSRIRSLIAAGKPYTLAIYPGAEHGMTEYELDAHGARVSLRFAPGYFQMMADFIVNGRIGDKYGNAALTQPMNR